MRCKCASSGRRRRRKVALENRFTNLEVSSCFHSSSPQHFLLFRKLRTKKNLGNDFFFQRRCTVEWKQNCNSHSFVNVQIKFTVSLRLFQKARSHSRSLTPADISKLINLSRHQANLSDYKQNNKHQQRTDPCVAACGLGMTYMSCHNQSSRGVRLIGEI